MVIETTIAEKMVLNRFFKCQIMNIDTLLVKSFGLIKKKKNLILLFHKDTT